MSDFVAFISNGASLDLAATRYYAAIIGLAPSKGARSPLLWNRALKSLGVSAVMHPMDVTLENLSVVVQGLRADPNFLGGAVAAPYKQAIVPLIDDLDEEARAIGAVNCLYRRDGCLVGSNTDGAASLLSLKRLIAEPTLSGLRALLLGVGGAGRAVAAFVAKAIGQDGILHLANRTPCTGGFPKRLGQFCQVKSLTTWPVSDDTLRKSDLIINCTSIGSELIHADQEGAFSLLGYTPLAPVTAVRRVPAGDDFYLRFAHANQTSIGQNLEESWRKLQNVEKAVLYDIVYQPGQTILGTLAKTRGLKCLGGELMNLEQAVIAFIKAVGPIVHDPLDSSEVEMAMTTSN